MSENKIGHSGRYTHKLVRHPTSIVRPTEENEPTEETAHVKAEEQVRIYIV